MSQRKLTPHGLLFPTSVKTTAASSIEHQLPATVQIMDCPERVQYTVQDAWRHLQILCRSTQWAFSDVASMDTTSAYWTVIISVAITTDRCSVTCIYPSITTATPPYNTTSPTKHSHSHKEPTYTPDMRTGSSSFTVFMELRSICLCSWCVSSCCLSSIIFDILVIPVWNEEPVKASHQDLNHRDLKVGGSGTRFMYYATRWHLVSVF